MVWFVPERVLTGHVLRDDFANVLVIYSICSVGKEIFETLLLFNRVFRVTGKDL